MSICSPSTPVRLSRLHALECGWVGWSRPPVRLVMAAAGWSPERADVACPRCGTTCGPGEADDVTGCASCRGRRPRIARTVRLGPFAGPLRDWIHVMKYGAWHEMGAALGAALGEVVRSRIDVDPGAVVVPMPMPALRRWYRGIDHADVIATALAATLGLRCHRLLVRRWGPTQVGRSATERRRLGGQVIRPRRRTRRAGLDGRPLILVDDVRTTGGSLVAAARAASAWRPSSITAAVLAVADDPLRRRVDSGGGR